MGGEGNGRRSQRTRKRMKYGDYGIETGVLEGVIELQTKDERIRLEIKEGMKKRGEERGTGKRKYGEKDGEKEQVREKND